MSTSDINDNNEFFEDLIDYNDGESVKEEVDDVDEEGEFDKNLTFLQPNIDVNPNQSNQYYFHNFNNEKIKDMMSNPIAQNSNNYVLEIVEQPQQCRISGSGDKDRRPIDPAPIVKLSLLHPNNHIENVVECPFYVLHVSLWSSDMTKNYDLIESEKPTRTLIGSLVSTPSLLKDLNDEKHYFFAFPDLSIKMTGQFRLKFSLIHLGSNEIIKEIFSDILTVYSAKAFPGMKESSELAKHLSKQGLKLTIRSQLRFKNK